MNANRKDETTKTRAKSEVIPAIDRIPMDERRRWLIKIVMLIRYTFRGYFGLKFANKWGFYVDRHMSRKIHEFQDWIDYPKGDHVLEGHEVSVRAAVVSDDGYSLFTADYLGMIKVWNMLDSQMIREWKGHKGTIKTLAFQSGLLVSGSFDTSVKIWDTWRDYQLVHFLKGHKNGADNVDINAKATQVVSGSSDKSIRIWSVKTGECIRVMMGHSENVTTVQFIGDIILSGSWDKSIKVWNPSDGTEIQSVNEGINGRIFTVSINYDASLIACGMSRYGLTLHTWPHLKYIRNVVANPLCCRFHPLHPNILAVTDHDNTSIRILDLTNDDVIRILDGHYQFVSRLCFTPDGTRLVSVSDDKFVRIWDVSDV